MGGGGKANEVNYNTWGYCKMYTHACIHAQPCIHTCTCCQMFIHPCMHTLKLLHPDRKSFKKNAISIKKNKFKHVILIQVSKMNV